MKIGQVVKEFGVSVNTLYFYINNGILVPPRKNSQYDFDECTLDDLRWLLELRDMAFPLKTIHRLLSLKRISSFCSEEDQLELRTIYQTQLQSLEQQEAALFTAKKKLSQAISRLALPAAGGGQAGVPLSALGLLCCPCCHGELLLNNASMNQSYIFQADLHCACGYTAKIQDGIVQTVHGNTSLHDKPDTTRELYRDLPSKTLSLFEQSYHWLENHLRALPSGGRVWLEGYVNAWFFFHNHLDLLSPQDTLVVVDKFPETLLAYKEVIQRQGCPCPILYIADSSDAPPIRPGAIQCVMDFFAANEHNFYHQDLYLNTLRPYLSPDCRLFGVYFFFRRGVRSMKKLLDDYPEAAPHNFDFHWFRQALSRHFLLLETEDLGPSLDSGKNLGLGFHVAGEELHLQPYCARPRREDHFTIR